MTCWCGGETQQNDYPPFGYVCTTSPDHDPFARIAPMTPDRLAEIQAAAEAATRIPNGCCHAGANEHHRHFLHSYLDGSAAKTPWGRFIATADPPTVLELVAEVERLAAARAEVRALRERIAEEEQAYQAANERAEKLWLELYGDTGTKRLMSAYLTAWGGGIPKLWHDAFTALGAHPLDDVQEAFDIAQRCAALLDPPPPVAEERGQR